MIVGLMFAVHELKEFKCFCFMGKPLDNSPKATMRVNL